MSTTNFQVRQLIRLRNLNNASYNGKLGEIGLFPSGEVCCYGRYRVDLIDEVAPSLCPRVDVKPENLEHACRRCHKGGDNLMFCGSCRNTRYCDIECQRIDWERHKEECMRCAIARNVSKNPLIPAIVGANFLLVQKLVQEGIDVNMTSNTTNATALNLAASEGHAPIVEYLLQHGAEKDKADCIGMTALFLAAQNGRLQVVQCLAQLGADKNKAEEGGCSPLYVAVHQGHLPVVQYLLQQGADKDKANNDGTTPLHVAAHFGHAEVLSCLMRAGASLSAKDIYGKLPIDYAANEQIKQLILDEEKRHKTQVSTEKL